MEFFGDRVEVVDIFIICIYLDLFVWFVLIQIQYGGVIQVLGVFGKDIGIGFYGYFLDID